VKDRAALYIVRDAEERGLLTKGGTVVEGTAGNTGISALLRPPPHLPCKSAAQTACPASVRYAPIGIGLAHICKARGYKCKIFMPNTQSQEKIDLLRALGAEVLPVPAVPFEVRSPPHLGCGDGHTRSQQGGRVNTESGQLQPPGEGLCPGHPKLRVDQPVRQRGQPLRPLLHHWTRNLVPNPAQGGCVHGLG